MVSESPGRYSKYPRLFPFRCTIYSGKKARKFEIGQEFQILEWRNSRALAPTHVWRNWEKLSTSLLEDLTSCEANISGVVSLRARKLTCYWVDLEQILDVGNERIEASVLEDLTTCEADLSGEPYEGMIFDSEDAARMFYDEYAGRIGFWTRILSSRKSERDGSIISRGLGCRGNRDVQSPGKLSNDMGQKRREGCSSMLIVKRENIGRWVVRKFVKDHNHPLVVSSPKKRPTFDEKDKKIQDLTAELRLKKRLSAAYREQLLTLMKDVENHNDNLTTKLQTIRSNLKEIEAKRQELSNH